MRQTLRVLLLVFLVMSMAGLSWAQATTGTFLGTVTDSTDAVIPNVSVRVVNIDTNFEKIARTNESGNYSIVGLPAGVYRLEFERSGFGKLIRSAQELRVGEQQRHNEAMKVFSPGADSANVISTPPLIEADSAAIGGVITERQIRELPLNGRQFETLAQLFPGAVTPAPGSHLSYRGGFNFGGVDEHYNSFFLDGIDNVDPVVRNFSFRPSVDNVAEFQVLERGYNAEFGRNAGAVINVITKSGTNQLHGSFWEFLRNDNLDARNVFAPAAVGKPQLIRNQFGLALGGPLKRDKTFFFLGYEGLRQKASAIHRATVPTLRMRTGDLGEYGVPITDPRNGQVYSDGVIPQQAIVPVAREVLQAFPLPNGSGLSANRTEVANRIDNGNDVSLRIDHSISAGTKLMGRYSTSITRILDPFRTETGQTSNLSEFPQTADKLRTNLGLTLTTTRGSRFVNELRAGYNRFNQPQIPLNSGTPAQTALMGFEKTFLDFTVTPFDMLGSGQQFKRAVNVYNYIDSVSYAMGNHQLKVGVDVRRYLFNQLVVGPNAFQFFGTRSGNALADFLFGLPTRTTSTTGNPGGNTRKTEVAAYIQDDWKVTPRLTVNYGLRWEYYGRITEKNNKQSVWSADCNCIKVAGQGIRPGLVPNDFNNFAPRLGFAFRPAALGMVRTVIRGAAGIYYDSDMRHNAEVNGNPPFVLNQSYLSQLIPSLSMSDPFPANSGVANLVPFTLDAKYRDTYLEDWSLGVQHEFDLGNTGPLLVDVSYVGNHSVKARRGINLDQPVNGVAPYPGFVAILDFEQAGSSSFNALQARVERRFRHGLGFMSSYMWGHAIDDRPGQGAGRVQDYYNLKAERGDADFDVRHRWTLSGVYELPFGKGRQWGGWSLNGIATMQGGRPFTVFLAQDNSRSGNFSDRPNLVPGVSWKPVDQGPNHWINPAAFSVPAAGTFGNLGRNTLRGPRFHNVDMSLAKNFRMTDRGQLQFRAEVFNLFNHPNFGLPSSTLSTLTSFSAQPGFGVIPVTVGPERQIQFGLRFEF